MLLALGAVFAAAPGAAWADEVDGGQSSPPELIAPPGCDYSAGECPIVFDPATDRCVVSRHRVWVARGGEWTIINWTWGDNAELDAAISAANDQFTEWIVNSDIDALSEACGFKKPDENPGDSGEQTPPPTTTPVADDSNQTGLPPIPEECNQGSGRYVCPDGNPPYGCWAVRSSDRPSSDDSPASDRSDSAESSSNRWVGLCIDPPIDPSEIPIDLCTWEPTSCQIPVDPPCTVGADGERVCALAVDGLAPNERGTGSAASGQPKHKAAKKHKAGRKHKAAKKPKAAKRHKAGKKHKAAKKPAKKKSPKSDKRRASKR
ncbi:MAG: hypothetical protein NT122_07105 [Solirubrobacterales bacterium]|nr:hypothetical protein [Solirubrobacterales bacterium]